MLNAKLSALITLTLVAVATAGPILLNLTQARAAPTAAGIVGGDNNKWIIDPPEVDPVNEIARAFPAADSVDDDNNGWTVILVPNRRAVPTEIVDHYDGGHYAWLTPRALPTPAAVVRSPTDESYDGGFRLWNDPRALPTPVADTVSQAFAKITLNLISHPRLRVSIHIELLSPPRSMRKRTAAGCCEVGGVGIIHQSSLPIKRNFSTEHENVFENIREC
ncbi:hypothetical protein DFH09DRAFT_1410138 [Mycena vulgaris]|nr:hypothetical protein DFH09DRAFT_1410138 [Mycena vulgaris]